MFAQFIILNFGIFLLASSSLRAISFFIASSGIVCVRGICDGGLGPLILTSKMLQ
jgi:hypothetical protein